MLKRASVLGIIGFASTYLLYRNIWVSAGGAFAFILYAVLDRKHHLKYREEKIQACFLDFLMCIEPLLKTYGTFSQSFSEAAKDYKRFHGNDYLSICLDSAVNEFKLNLPTAQILEKIATRLDIEDARIFAGSMAVCESTGGNAVEITASTTELLVGRTRVVCDVKTMISGKVLEQKIITVMPFMLLGVLSVSSGSYLEPLYSTLEGRLIMSVAAFLFILQWFIGKRLTDIKV